MLALTIEDQKLFTKELFVGDAFHKLLCSKVTIHHNIDYVMEGRYHLDFYDSEEREEKSKQVYASWEEVQPLAFQIIKGKRLPLSFQIVLCASSDMIHQLIVQSGTSLTPSQVDGLFFNIHYTEEHLTVTTGSSFTLFTMDKSLERVWEEAIKKRIALLNISFH